MDEGESQLHVCDASVSLAFSILGKRWNGMILSTLGTGPMSFTALRRTVTVSVMLCFQTGWLN